MIAAASTPAPRMDPGRLVWAAVTIRVAWELHLAGQRPTPAVLRDARAHVMLSLPQGVGREQAEELASYFTREYVERVRHGRYRRRPPTPEPLRTRPSWRGRLIEVLDPVGEVVLRLIYGDGMGVETVERLTRVDRVVLKGALQGVRAAFRQLLADDGITQRLSVEELDKVLARVARTPAADCRGGEEIITPRGLGHAERCPRCARGVRLLRAGLLSPSDLLPPEGRSAWPTEQASVLVLHLHPDARHHRKVLVETFSAGREGVCIRADDDALLIDPDRIDDHVGPLHLLAEEGTPRRDHVRGALIRGAGRWTPTGLLGPVASAGVEATRARPWGEVDGAGLLPEPLPEPPSAARWWSLAMLVTLMAIVLGLFTLRPVKPEPAYPLAAGVMDWSPEAFVRFDVHDEALLLVVVDGAEGLELLHRSELPSDKGDLATGQGDYFIAPEGHTLLIASSPEPYEDVDALIAASRVAAEPLEDLAERLSALQAEADLRVLPLTRPEP
ncbi:MAG: hypothetical protein H6741_06540 [Alphaproteobacteria bacterium]|nr:hypothetical protein [Alphaproteobacteria bacterium]MCB9792369.1 hypothetical protein [Alphaproteobacteria bacterium]